MFDSITELPDLACFIYNTFSFAMFPLYNFYPFQICYFDSILFTLPFSAIFCLSLALCLSVCLSVSVSLSFSSLSASSHLCLLPLISVCFPLSLSQYLFNLFLPPSQPLPLFPLSFSQFSSTLVSFTLSLACSLLSLRALHFFTLVLFSLVSYITNCNYRLLFLTIPCCQFSFLVNQPLSKQRVWRYLHYVSAKKKHPY